MILDYCPENVNSTILRFLAKGWLGGPAQQKRAISWFPKIKTTRFREFECPFKRNVCPLSMTRKAFNYEAYLFLLVDAAPAPGRLGRLTSPNIQHQEDPSNLPSLPRPNSSNPRCSMVLSLYSAIACKWCEKLKGEQFKR
jgi:hypothetical protein